MSYLDRPVSARPAMLAILVCCFGCISTPAWGLNIVLDYTHDTYIQTNPAAMAAIEAAADDIEGVITSTLPQRFDSNSVTVGKATATLDWRIDYTNPATGANISIDPVDIPTDEYRIFVGVRPITQPGFGTKTLGRGGSAGVGISNGFSIEPIFQSEVPQAISDLGDAVAQLEIDANANAGRGGIGPTLGSFNNLQFSGNLGGQNFSFSADVNYGVGVGHLWFDVDTDDNGSIDNNSTLDDYWHWNHTTDTPFGKNDFYSVALHEILHTLGYGSSETWDSNINPSDPDEWVGAALVAELGGSGENAVDVGSGSHLTEGLTGVVFGTNISQEAVMDPTNTTGGRKLLTNLDVAVLEDLNWDVAAPPSLAGDYNDDGTVDAADYTVWRDNLGESAGTLPNDTDGGVIGTAQYATWKANFGSSSGSGEAGAVPEPMSICLLLTMLLACRRYS